MPANGNQPNDGSRRRIVIALGDQSSGTAEGTRSGRSSRPAKGRAGRILKVLGLLLIVFALLAAGGLYFGWQHYKTTPSYSLALLVDGAQRNDLTTVDSIIDTDKVVENFAGEITDQAVGRYGPLGTAVRQQIESLTPRLMPAIKQTTQAALVARVKEISQQANQKPFILIALAVPYFVNVDVSGDTAKAIAVVGGQRVELGLARAGERWKVVAMKDDALVQKAIDQVIKSLPVIGLDSEKKAPQTRRNRRLLPALPEIKLQ